MTIPENVSEFFGLPVQDFEGPDDWNGTQIAYRIRLDWETPESELIDRLERLAEQAGSDEISALVIGQWASDSGQTSEGIIKALVDRTGRFAGLRAIFLGDITVEENEISWIQQSDASPLLLAYPALETLRVRGGNDLQFSQVRHEALKQLIVETGGLPRSVIREIFRCDLSNLEHLELWLGSGEYGWDGGPEDLQPLLAGKHFPRLKYLGIRNSDMIDEIAPVLVNSPILERIETLDLSLGNISDTGGRALLSLGADCKLSKLILSHHYLSDGLVQRLTSELPCEVIAEDGMSPDEEWRSNYVSE